MNITEIKKEFENTFLDNKPISYNGSITKIKYDYVIGWEKIWEWIELQIYINVKVNDKEGSKEKQELSDTIIYPPNVVIACPYCKEKIKLAQIQKLEL